AASHDPPGGSISYVQASRDAIGPAEAATETRRAGAENSFGPSTVTAASDGLCDHPAGAWKTTRNGCGAAPGSVTSGASSSANGPAGPLRGTRNAFRAAGTPSILRAKTYSPGSSAPSV